MPYIFKILLWRGCYSDVLLIINERQVSALALPFFLATVLHVRLYLSDLTEQVRTANYRICSLLTTLHNPEAAKTF